MTTYFWVGGGASTNWNATSNTNWALSSGGARLATTLPTTGDTCIFDNNSVSPAVANVAISLAALDFGAGGTQYLGLFTHPTATTITISAAGAPALRMSPGMTYAPASTTSLFMFTNTSGVAQFTSAGKAFAAITLNGAGGTVQQKDDLNVNAVQAAILTITNGVWDAFDGGAPHALTACIVNCPAGTRTFSHGGLVKIGGNVGNNQTIWGFGTTAGLTYTKNSGNIEVLAPQSAIAGSVFAGGGLTYNGLTLDPTSNKCILQMSGANAFASFATGAGWSLWIAGGNITITAPFAWVGTQALPINVSNSFASQSNISCPSGACSLNWGALSGSAAVGGATFTATNVFDFGNNSGWAITPPNDVAGVNVTQIAGSTAAATALNKATNTVARGTVTTGASTTSVPTSALTIGPLGAAATGVVANQFGSTGNATRTLMFDGDTLTAGLRGAEGTITANTASNTPTFTVSVLPATPASGDTFSIV